MLLFLLTLLPISLFLWPKISIYILRWVNLVQSLLILIISTILVFNYSILSTNILEAPYWWLMPFEDKISLSLLNYDGISLAYVWLTSFIFSIVFLSVWGNTKQPKFLLCLLSLIQLLLVGAFLSSDMLLFYILFEGILIPMFLIIGIWGSRSEKIKASYYFFFYTLVGSVLFIVGILYLQIFMGTTNSLLIIWDSAFVQKFLWICFFIAFAVKIPMFPAHIWLPEAHVEAPTAGSVILAALLLKLGSYGYLRFMLPVFNSETTQYFWPLVISLAGSSVILASLTAIRQIDIKRIIAYSSIAHMNLAVLGLFSNTYNGLNGGLVLTVAHGFVSAAMFLLIGILYDRYHSRLVYHYGGLVRVMPLFAIFFILFSLANMGFPLSYNFIGELTIVLGLFSLHLVYGVIGLIGILLSVVYVMWLTNRLLFGDISVKYINQFYDLDFKEFINFLLLLVPTVVFGIFPDLLELVWFNDLRLLID